MSPAFERRLARIDKAFDRIRHARDRENEGRGLAETYLRMATVICIYEAFGDEAAMWALSGEGPPPPALAAICDASQRDDTEDLKPRAAQSSLNHNKAARQ